MAAGLSAPALVQQAAAAQDSGQPDIVPILECVRRNEEGDLTAYFGWNNRSGRTLRPVLGTENRIVPVEHQAELVVEFAEGLVTTLKGGFTISFAEDEKITWFLYDEAKEASRASQPCAGQGGATPPTTAKARTTTTVARGAAQPGSDAGPPGRGGAAAGNAAGVLAASSQAAQRPPALGLADVVPAVLLGLVVLGAVAFGLDSTGRRTRS